MASSKHSLLCLPTEFIDEIISGLTNADLKNLRLACRQLSSITKLRLHRVFLSPNPRDIEVFWAVAGHEDFRKNIVEIIYDDARFAYTIEKYEEEAAAVDYYSDCGSDEDEEYGGYGDVSGVPRWFLREYRDNSEEIEQHGRRDVKKPYREEIKKRIGARLNPAESYRQYRQLAKKQEEVIAASSDVDALQYGLTRFPNLRRITLTLATYGCPIRPFYQTPMIRSLPCGLIYPLPRGWPTAEIYEHEPLAEVWDTNARRHWRGFCIVSQAIAQLDGKNLIPPSFSEFVIDTNKLLTGINCRIFDQADSPEYHDLVTIVSRPGLPRLDLPLLVGGQYHRGWPSFRSGHLKNLLCKAPNLEHLSISTNVGFPDDIRNLTPSGAEERFVPLHAIFPVDAWSNLRHFGLSRFIVKQQDLIDFLLALPVTLRSVELSFLDFLPDGDYRKLLENMKEVLDWRKRKIVERPKIMIYVDTERLNEYFFTDVSKMAEDFVYGDWKNPFQSNSWVPTRTGTNMAIFDPEFERPNVDDVALIKLGIVEMDDWHKKHYFQN